MSSEVIHEDREKQMMRPGAEVRHGHSFKSCMSLAAALVLTFGASAADVQVQDPGGGHYTLTVRLAGTTDPTHGQIVITPTAQDLCGVLHPHFGRYRFESSEPAIATGSKSESSITYIQQIQCRDTPQQHVGPSSSPVPPAPPTPPTAQDEAWIRESTLAYLHAKTVADAEAAYAMLSREMTEYATSDVWREQNEAFNGKAGPGAVSDVVRMTWYDDPQGAPTHGRYAAADYRVDYPSHAFTCGYVVWLRQADGGYLIVRQEEGQALPDLIKDLSAEQLVAMRQQLQCRD